ncbi:unnamed protein product [Phytomonas sp. Hart1]|nr:unnamed protein product [Phytomonas sp. Hart1]|eukprot:CCW65991.1 unnamed protein product [Phytomonas sp. isolate Hart1]
MNVELDPSSPPQPHESHYTWNSILLERWLSDMSEEYVQEESRQRLRNAVGLFPLPILHIPSALHLLDCGEEVLRLFAASEMTTTGPKYSPTPLRAETRIKYGGVNVDDRESAAAPLFASPFRFARTEAFHKRLREQANNRDIRAVVEKRCHGFHSEEVLAESALSRAGPSTRAARGQRKPQRPPSPPKSFQPELQVGGLDLHSRRGIKSNMRMSIVGGQRQDPNTYILGSLATRIMENDNVLNELLLGDVSMCSAEDPTVPSSHLCPTSVTTSIACKGDVTANGTPQTLPFSLGSSTLKELRDRCAANGLLLSGTKSDLYHRLMLFQERQRPDMWTGLPHQPMDVALPTTVVGPVNGDCSTDPLEKRSPSPSPPPRFDSLSHPSAASPTISQLREVSNGLFSFSREDLSLSSSSPPPKRTVFRYHSCKSKPPLNHSEANQVHSRTNDLGFTERKILQVPPQDGTTLEQGLSPCRRVVPTPEIFIQELLNNPLRSNRPRLLPHEKSRRPCGLHGGVMSQDRVTACKPVTTEGPQWQWLVDTRERVRGKHNGMLALLEQQHVPCASCMLPCGDFMLNVNVGTFEAEEDTAQDQCRSVDANSRGGVQNDATWTVPQDLSQSISTFSLPLFPYLCSLVVERKTVADLDASIKGNRYLEQRNLLLRSRFQLIVWLIEGSEASSGRGHRGNGSPCTVNAGNSFFGHAQRDPLRSKQQPDKEGVGEKITECRVPDKRDGLCGIETAFSSLIPEGQRRVYSACMSLTHQPGFCVVRTRTVQESVTFLKHLGAAVAHQVARALATGSTLAVGSSSFATQLSSPFPSLLPTMPSLQRLQKLQKSLRAQTVFPRMLMCIRGCSSALAQTLFNKYGSFYNIWKELQERGALACDEDEDIVKLSVSQKKVFVLLTEFIMSREYY